MPYQETPAGHNNTEPLKQGSVPDIARPALQNLGLGVKRLSDAAVYLNERRLKVKNSLWKKTKDVLMKKTRKALAEIAAV